MTEEQYSAELTEMFMPREGADDYNMRKEEAENLVVMALADIKQRGNGEWKDDIAKERFKEWQWFHSEINPPETIILPEPLLHASYTAYLKKRNYSAHKIPENASKMTPDFLVSGGGLEFLNEFKAPELVYNRELRLYKFQTTHSKVLTFISKAVKQFHAEDPQHEKPWVMTFASTHSQLNWTDFMQSLQGGVAYDNKLSPDFTDTEVYKRVIVKAKEIDLYIWLQVNHEGNIFQVSLIGNKDSKFSKEIEKIVIDLSSESISSMDNIIMLEWPR